MIDPCIDAEVLAAWVDGALDRRAAGEVERHAAQCARCQAMLATFVRTEFASSPLPQTRPAPWWQSFQVRWLVPIAAAATAAAIWIALPGRPRPEGEVARAPSASVAAPPAQSPATPLAVAEPSAAPPDANQREMAPARKDAPAEPAGGRQEVAPNPALQQERANTLADAERRVAEAGSAPGTVGLNRSREAALRTASPDDATMFVSHDGSVRWRLATPGVERSTDGGSTWVAAPLGNAAEQDGRAAAPLAGAAAKGDPRPAIVAGDAPTALVCWLVGPRGAVWITADGGQQFRRVTVTGEPDLRTVRARDAGSADVTTVDGRSFRTDDGGSTWKLVSP